MSDIFVGMAAESSVVVDKTNLASAVGSGLVDVFATPQMIALIELAASNCIQPRLNDGQVSVGTYVRVDHSSATPIGMKVTATATVSAVDRRSVDFDVVVRDEVGEVGRGTHGRFVVDKAKFMEKAEAKRPTE
ncbi:MAG: thioesterase family protein [Planctomycetaceae bacterium]|nr:thioesterase family protein [Planctomycetaceae bacterium]